MPVNTVVTTILIIRFPRCRKAAILQCRHIRLLLMVAGCLIETETADRNAAIGAIHLCPDIRRTTATLTLIIFPDDRITAIGQTGDRGLVLGPGCVSTIHQLLAANGIPVTIKLLNANIAAGAAAMAAVIAPSDNKTAIRKTGDRRLVLGGTGIGVDEKGVSKRLTILIQTLTANVPAAATIVTTAILPRNNIIATCKTGNRRILLFRSSPGINPSFPGTILRNLDLSAIAKT